jgi:hypothetical protein
LVAFRLNVHGLKQNTPFGIPRKLNGILFIPDELLFAVRHDLHRTRILDR